MEIVLKRVKVDPYKTKRPWTATVYDSYVLAKSEI